MTSARTTDPTRDVVDILTDDHHEMIAAIDEIAATIDPTRRRELTDAVTAEIMRHSVAEELFVYPEITRRVPGGAAQVEDDKDEHSRVEVVLKTLEDASTESAEFTTLLAELKKLLEVHAASEETRQFPGLRENLDAATLHGLGKRVEAAKVIAPTRPHPGSPNSELFHMTLGPGVGMVDRLRDALTGRLAPGRD